MKRVLLVEDDDAIAEVIAVILYESGYAVDRVSNVADALVSVHGEPPPLSYSISPCRGRAGFLFCGRPGRARR